MRRENWVERLEAFIAANQSRAFRYGDWDCWQFARGAIEAQTGVDLGAQFRPYASQFGYLRQMRQYCGSINIAAFAGSVFAGLPSIEPEMAQRGDVVLTADGAFGIVALNGRSILMLSHFEIVSAPRDQVVTAWRV